VTGRGCWAEAATGAMTGETTAVTGETTAVTGAMTGKMTGVTGAMTGKTVAAAGPGYSGDRGLDDQAVTRASSARLRHLDEFLTASLPGRLWAHETEAMALPAAGEDIPRWVGRGKLTRFGLQDKAEALGAQVALLQGPGTVDVAALARQAVADGADLLGVAGGDGTQRVHGVRPTPTCQPYVSWARGTGSQGRSECRVHPLRGKASAAWRRWSGTSTEERSAVAAGRRCHAALPGGSGHDCDSR